MKWSIGKQLLAPQPHYRNLYYPTSPLCLFLGRGAACQGNSPYKPPSTWQTSIDGPGVWWQMSGGLGCAAVLVSPCQERVTTVWHYVPHQQKIVSTRFWGIVVLSSYFPCSAFQRGVWELLITSLVNLLRIFFPPCHYFSCVNKVHVVNVTLTKVCVFHLPTKIPAGCVWNITDNFSRHGRDKEKKYIPC